MKSEHNARYKWKRRFATFLAASLVFTACPYTGTEGLFSDVVGKITQVKAADDPGPAGYFLRFTNNGENTDIYFTGDQEYTFLRGGSEPFNVNELNLTSPDGSTRPGSTLSFDPNANGVSTVGTHTGSKFTDPNGVCDAEISYNTNGEPAGLKLIAKKIGAVDLPQLTFRIASGNYASFTIKITVPPIVFNRPVYNSSSATAQGYRNGYDILLEDKNINTDLHIDLPGWSRQIELVGSDYNPGSTYTSPSEDVVKWETKSKDSISLDAENGTVTVLGAGESTVTVSSDYGESETYVGVPLQISDKKPEIDAANGNKWNANWKYFKKAGFEDNDELDECKSTNDNYISKDNTGNILKVVDDDTGHTDTSLTIYSNVYNSDNINYKILRKNGDNGKSQGQSGTGVEFTERDDMSEYIETEDKTGDVKNGLAVTEFKIHKAGLYKVIMSLKNVTDDKTKGKIYTKVFYIQVNGEGNLHAAMGKGDNFNPFTKKMGMGPYGEYTTTLSSGANKYVEVNNNNGKIKIIDSIKDQSTVTVTYDAKNDYGYKYKLTVKIAAGNTFSISKYPSTLRVGQTYTAKVDGTVFDLKDKNGTDPLVTEGDVEWTVGNGLSVKPSGLKEAILTASGTGEAVPISATVNVNGVEITDTKYVTIKPAKKLDNFVSPAAITLEMGKSEIVSFTDPDAKAEDIEWLPSGGVATFTVDKDSFKITAAAPGTQTYTALNKATGEYYGFIDVTVIQPVASVTIEDPSPIVRAMGSTYQLHWKVEPATAEQGVTFESNHTEIATVDENGLITFVKGAVTPASITVKSVGKMEDGSRAEATIEVVCTTPQSGVTLDKDKLTLMTGETYNFKIKVNPADASDKTYKIVSSDPTVGTVTVDGTFTALSPGKTVVTLTSGDGKHTAKCEVTVKQNPTGIALDTTEVNVDVGDTYTVKVSFEPETATEKGLIWSSSDDTIATVEDGVITGVSVGNCEVTASTTNGKFARVIVHVYQSLGGLTLNVNDVTIDKGETYQLEAKFDPDDATNQDLTWSSSNEDVATVDENGLVKGLKGGLSVIKVTSDDGNYSATCIVTVMERTSNLSVSPKTKVLEVGETVSLHVSASPASVTVKTYTWTSSNKKVATVNSSGVVTAKKKGTAKITVAVKDGSGRKAVATIKVVKRASSLALDKYLIQMIVGRTTTLKGIVKPKSTTMTNFKYKAGDENILHVTGNGKITALAAGTTTVTVTTEDGSKLSQKAKVIVREYIPATGLKLSAENMTMAIGDRQTVTYSLVPSNTDDKIKWDTNNKHVATISKNGVITALAAGSATITGTTTSGQTASCTVTVVGLNFYTLNLEQYDTYNLAVLGDGVKASWDSSNIGVAVVSGNGTVTAKRAGSCYVYARVNGALLRCRVNVRNIR